MKLAALMLSLGLVLAGCSASEEDIKKAEDDARGRGFTVLSSLPYAMNDSTVEVYVSFGTTQKGCLGRLI
ncbi:MAG TPA: hypothetical protein VFT87_00910, partial [Candidatus Saccharimonadales bacterium]|nr:hypothetical protein [Candidatus Saccharimonadales bacterium]